MIWLFICAAILALGGAGIWKIFFAEQVIKDGEISSPITSKHRQLFDLKP